MVGPNGSGKSTFSGILAGTKNGKGMASAYGHDIESTQFREMITLCPQENILYDDFTIEQNLKLFYMMKVKNELSFTEAF